MPIRDFLQARMEPYPGKADEGLMILTLEVPPTARTCYYLGAEPGNLKLEFDHPRIHRSRSASQARRREMTPSRENTTVEASPSSPPAAGRSEHVSCGECQQSNGVDRQFCNACGKPLWEKCLKCGASCATSERFCGECGANQAELIDAQLAEIEQDAPGGDRPGCPPPLHRRHPRDSTVAARHPFSP